MTKSTTQSWQYGGGGDTAVFAPGAKIGSYGSAHNHKEYDQTKKKSYKSGKVHSSSKYTNLSTVFL
jgi:hypothetical protein